MRRRLIWLLLGLWTGLAWSENEPTTLTVFHAPAFSPVIHALENQARVSLGLTLRTEIQGSQMLCRLLTDGGQSCDLLWLSDAGLFKELAAPQVNWRIEFAHDEMVLAVGVRAPLPEAAEKNWVSVLLRPEVQLGRVDENLAPAGYRTLLVWSLQEQRGLPGLGAALKAKTVRIADHAEHLAAMLRNGDADYGFLYKTTCRQHDLRYITLDPAVHLGSLAQDYSAARAKYRKRKSGCEWTVTVRGAPITYGVSIPRRSVQPETARRYVAWMLNQHAADFSGHGYALFKPLFYGPRSAYEPFASWCDYAGPF